MNIILLLVGFVFLAFGILQIIKVRKLTSQGIVTKAKILEIKQVETTSQDSEGYMTTGYSYSPVFEFTDKKGEKHTVESGHGFANSKKFKIGDDIEIIYLEDKPQEASIKKFGSLWSLPIILIFVGIMFVAVSFVS